MYDAVTNRSSVSGVFKETVWDEVILELIKDIDPTVGWAKFSLKEKIEMIISRNTCPSASHCENFCHTVLQFQHLGWHLSHSRHSMLVER